MIYDVRLIEQMISLKAGKKEKVPSFYGIIHSILKNRILSFFIGMFEAVAGFFLALQIPLFRDLALSFIQHLPGAPFFGGNYIRGIYWKRSLAAMGKNCIIEHGVIIRNPSAV